MDSGFAEFFTQLPIGIFVTLCGSALLLGLSFFLIARARMAGTPLGTKGSLNSLTSLARPRDRATGSDDSSSDNYPDMDLLLDVDQPAPDTSEAAPPVAPTPAPARRAGTYYVELADGRTVEAADLLTVARDLADGSLIIHIGDRAYNHINQVTDPDVRRRLLSALRQLDTLTQSTETTDTPRVNGFATPPAPAQPTDTAATAPTPDETSPQPEKPKDPPPPPTGTGGAMPGDLPKFQMSDTPINPRRKPPKEDIPELDIAGAIEAYLQHKISYTPAMQGRSIHVRPSFDGGVKIEVDGVFYDAVDEVRDTEIREFLSDTIAEWQSRQ